MASSAPRSVSVVVPVYRGANSITELVERTLTVFDTAQIDGEIILVNDDSPDESWDVICRLAEIHSRVRGVTLTRNFGQHGALLCGIRSARKNAIATIDDDLQHRPESLPELLDKLAEGYDVVYAAPKQMPHAKWRNFLSRWYKRGLAILIGSDSVLFMSAYRVFRTELRESFARFASPDIVIDFLLAWGTTRYATVFVGHDYRKYGRSTYSIPKLIYNTLVILTGYSVMPVHLATMIGFTFTVFGLGVFLYALVVSFTQHTLPGFTFIVSVVAVMSGAQLFCLGILGEYLGRIYQRTIDRPSYVVRATTGTGTPEIPGR